MYKFTQFKYNLNYNSTITCTFNLISFTSLQNLLKIYKFAKFTYLIYIKCVLRIPYENILMMSDFPHIRLCCLSYIITKLLRSFYVKLCNMNIDARRKKIYAQ